MLTDHQSFFPVVTGLGIQDVRTSLSHFPDKYSFSSRQVQAEDTVHADRYLTSDQFKLLLFQDSMNSKPAKPWDFLHPTQLHRVQSYYSRAKPLETLCDIRAIFLV